MTTTTTVASTTRRTSAQVDAEWIRKALTAMRATDKGAFFEAIDVLLNERGVTVEHIATVFKKSPRTVTRWKAKAAEYAAYYE